MKGWGLGRLLAGQQAGLLLVILALCAVLTSFAGSHADSVTGRHTNNFLNPDTLLQIASVGSLWAIMAIGATLVIISGGIDLSVGSTYALSAVITALTVRHFGDGASSVPIALGMNLGVGLLCGLFNGALIAYLRLHPFIITLGTMWAFRGVAFVVTKGNSVTLPDRVIAVVKSPLGLGGALHPVPLLIMILMTVLAAIYLTKTVAGRNIYAFGGSPDASRYSGLRTSRIQIGVYAISGLLAGLAAFVGNGFYGSANSGDATGYELYVIASAVVGGASLTGGKGTAAGALLGALLITLIGQSISMLHLDHSYEWIVIGAAVVLAVVLDRLNADLSAKRLARMKG